MSYKGPGSKCFGLADYMIYTPPTQLCYRNMNAVIEDTYMDEQPEIYWFGYGKRWPGLSIIYQRLCKTSTTLKIKRRKR